MSRRLTPKQLAEVNQIVREDLTTRFKETLARYGFRDPVLVGTLMLPEFRLPFDCKCDSIDELMPLRDEVSLQLRTYLDRVIRGSSGVFEKKSAVFPTSWVKYIQKKEVFSLETGT